MEPLTIYMINSLKKKLQSISAHPNPLIKALWDANINESVFDNQFYLSPFNLMNVRSAALFEPELGGALTLPFYKKVSLPALRG